MNESVPITIEVDETPAAPPKPSPGFEDAVPTHLHDSRQVMEHGTFHGGTFAEIRRLGSGRALNQVCNVLLSPEIKDHGAVLDEICAVLDRRARPVAS